MIATYIFLGNSPVSQHFRQGRFGVNDPSDLFIDRRGYARCNQSTGNVDTYVLNEFCRGSCVLKHENIHAQQMGSCCAKLAQRCAQNPFWCFTYREEFRYWVEGNRAVWECDAHNSTMFCLSAIVSDGCGEGGDIDCKCCEELRKGVKSAAILGAAYCAEAKAVTPGAPYPCPFD